MNPKNLLKQRQQILDALSQLGPMRRGSITSQVFERTDAHGRVVRRGPYPLLTAKEKGRTVSKRLHGSADVERCRTQIENYRLFEKLTRRLIEVGEALCQATDDPMKKKLRSSPSKRTPKSCG